MFPSSGFFADIDCPFSKRGLCERPHCLYRHATETPDVPDACHISSLTGSAGQCFIQCLCLKCSVAFLLFLRSLILYHYKLSGH